MRSPNLKPLIKLIVCGPCDGLRRSSERMSNYRILTDHLETSESARNGSYRFEVLNAGCRGSCDEGERIDMLLPDGRTIYFSRNGASSGATRPRSFPPSITDLIDRPQRYFL